MPMFRLEFLIEGDQENADMLTEDIIALIQAEGKLVSAATLPIMEDEHAQEQTQRSE